MSEAPEPSRAAALLAELRSWRWVDLTHAFEPGIPHYAGFPDEQRTTLYAFDEGEGTMGSGFYVHEYRHVGQWGTHMDPPVHFARGGRTQDQVPVEEMILPLVVLDITAEAERDPDAEAGLEVIREHEAAHGPIPEGAFVAFRSGWGRRWPDAEATAAGGHHPGWSAEALRWLVTERSVTAVGHDVTDTDPGATVAAGETPAETYILGADRWQIELMSGLEAVPPVGALIVATWPKPRGGSGFPARCFALVPAG